MQLGIEKDWRGEQSKYLCASDALFLRNREGQAVILFDNNTPAKLECLKDLMEW